MFKVRLALFGALTLFTLSGVVTSVASAEGPFWHVAKAKLTQGTRQIKLQVKGAAVLKTPELAVEIECTNSVSEGATIEGNGTKFQGQGKGRVTYTQCAVLKPTTCTVAEPITTLPLKSYLATANTQTKIVSVFEPTEGSLFTTLTFSGSSCPSAIVGARGVNGNIAAELIPSEVEGQEGLIAFPKSAISIVKHEGQEKKIALKAIGFPSTFSGVYGARLATFPETFGVFET